MNEIETNSDSYYWRFYEHSNLPWGFCKGRGNAPAPAVMLGACWDPLGLDLGATDVLSITGAVGNLLILTEDCCSLSVTICINCSTVTTGTFWKKIAKNIKVNLSEIICFLKASSI